jgi:hypothetical protein
MANSCPDCGSTVEYADREVLLRTGTCASCGHAFTFVAGSALEVGSPVVATPPAVGETPAPAEGGPECAECGTPLIFRARSDGSIEANCEECESTTVFVPSTPDERRPAPRERPMREEREAPSGPRGRPCRQCGAPLRFTTNDEGLLVGECDSCGNKFTLPPRDASDRGRSGDRGGGRPGGRRFGPPRGRPSWGRGTGGPGRGPRTYGRDRRDGDDDDRETRPRRRRYSS